MQICKYMYQVCYEEVFNGVINGKQVSSKIITVGGHTFIGTASGKAIWVQVKKKKGGVIRFSMPISQMFNVNKSKIDGKTFIIFEMQKGMHNSATYGKKDKDGKRIFKPKKSCFNCAGYNPTSEFSNRYASTGSSGSSGGRRI